MKYLLLFCCVLALSGCGEPKLDGTSEETMKASVVQVASKLPAEKKAKFEKAVQVVAFSKVSFKDVVSGKQTPEHIASGMFAELNGKTADEVIASADVIIEERKAREREQAVAEIHELTAKLSKADEAKTELLKFSVVRSRFYLRDKEYSSRKEPIIELKLNNGTAYPVSRAYFKGTVASPGRAVPWLVEDFNYSMPGGIEPGESGELTLAPNMFSKWGKVSAPVDAVFTVEVTRIDGADGKALFDSVGLSEREQRRLADLKQKYQ
jgi:hypothetical protein